MSIMSARPFQLLVSTCVFALAAAAVPAQDGAPPLQWVGGGQYDMSGLDVSADGAQLVTSSSTDGTVKLWTAADGSFVRTLSGAAGGVDDVAFSPDGTRVVTGGEVVFGGSTSAVLVWDV